MNQTRAAEANKHRLAVAQALLAKDGVVKHVQHQGRSVLYVCLPALHEEFLNSHRVFIPSYAAFVKTLDHPLVHRDRPYSHRFHSQTTKAAAVAFTWSSDRSFPPTAEELAELLHLDESIGPAAPKPAAAGTSAGVLPAGAVAANGEQRLPFAATSQAPTLQNPAVPTALNSLFQTVPKGVGLTWGRRSKAALQMRQQLWEQKQQQQQQQAVGTSARSSESPQQSEEATLHEQPVLATAADMQTDSAALLAATCTAQGAAVTESEVEARQPATDQPHKPIVRIPPYMVLTEEQRQQLQEQRRIAGLFQQEAGTTAVTAVAAAAGDAAAGDAAGNGTARQQGVSGYTANGAVQGISSGGSGGSSGGSSNRDGQGMMASDGSPAAAPGAAAASTAGTSAAATDCEKERCAQEEGSFVANSRTGSSSNLLAGQPQQQQQHHTLKQAAGAEAGAEASAEAGAEATKQPQQQHQQANIRKRRSGQEPLKHPQEQHNQFPEGRKKQRTTALATSSGGSNARAAAAGAAAADRHQQQEQGCKPNVRPLPLGMQVAHISALQQQHWEQAHGHQQQQQQQGDACTAPMGSQQVMQQQLKQMLGIDPELWHPLPHSSFISVGYQQQQQLMAVENPSKATKQLKQQRSLARQTEMALPPPQPQQQYLPGHSVKAKVLPLPVAMQMGRKTEQQRLQLQSAFRQAWQQRQQHQQRQQQKGHHWQQRKPSILKPQSADVSDVVWAAGHAQAGSGSASQQVAGGPMGRRVIVSGQLDVHPASQPGVHLSGQAGARVSGQLDVHPASQPGVHLSGSVGADYLRRAAGLMSCQPGVHLLGQAGARVSGQPGNCPAGQAADAAMKFSMKAVFSGRQMKRLKQLLKQQQDEDEGMAEQQQWVQEQPSTDWQQQLQQDFGTQLVQQQQQTYPARASAFEQEREGEEHQMLGRVAQQHHTSLPLKRKPLETGSYLLASAAPVPAAAAAAGIGAACDHALLLPPPQRRKRVSSDAGLMSKPCPRFEYTLIADEAQEVTSLLAAVCVMVGAAGLQHLVAAIDQLLLPGTAARDVQRQQGRDQVGNKQQQQNAADLPSRSAAAAGPARQSSAPTAANEKGGMSKELLAAVRWLAAKLGSLQQQQELVIPTLQQLCKDCPCLLETVSTLDGNALLSVTEAQLQTFLAGVLSVELQQSMQHLGIRAVQHSSDVLHATQLVEQQQQQELAVQQLQEQQQQQQQQADGNAKNGRGGAGSVPLQQQQQHGVVTGDPSTGGGGSSAGNALLQQQQQFAKALLTAYRAGRRVVCCRPKTLMMLTADRMMAAVVHEVKQQQQTLGLLSPAAQAAAVASVAARLAIRELQLAAAEAAGNPRQLVGNSHSSSAAAATATSAEQSASPISSNSSSNDSKAGLHLLNAFLLRSQFHPELQAGLLCVDMPNRCAVAAAAAGTTSDLRVSSAATVVFGFSLQSPQGFQGAQGAGHIQGSGDAERLNPAEDAPAADLKPLADKVLASWLSVGPDVVLWRKLVMLLLQIQQQQQEEQGRAIPSSDQQQQQYDLQQSYTKAQELLCNLQLQPDDLLHIHAQLKNCITSITQQQQQQQQRDSGVVLLQQTPGRGILLNPGWLHLQVNHEPNVTLWFDVLRARDAAAAAVVQREMPWIAQKYEQQCVVHVGPLILKALQQWYAYCQQQQQQ